MSELSLGEEKGREKDESGKGKNGTYRKKGKASSMGSCDGAGLAEAPGSSSAPCTS